MVCRWGRKTGCVVAAYEEGERWVNYTYYTTYKPGIIHTRKLNRKERKKQMKGKEGLKGERQKRDTIKSKQMIILNLNKWKETRYRTEHRAPSKLNKSSLGFI